MPSTANSRASCPVQSLLWRMVNGSIALPLPGPSPRLRRGLSSGGPVKHAWPFDLAWRTGAPNVQATAEPWGWPGGGGRFVRGEEGERIGELDPDSEARFFDRLFDCFFNVFQCFLNNFSMISQSISQSFFQASFNR